MMRYFWGMTLVALLFSGGAVLAETRIVENGGDTYVSGETVTRTVDTSGDLFVGGRATNVLGTVEGDVHVAGFDVILATDTNEDAYAAGATVTVRGAIGKDLTAAAYTLRTESSAHVLGNARLAGASLVIDGPVDGSLMVAGRDVLLNAPVLGDARITAATIAFGPNASIGGRLVFASDAQPEIPDRVIAPSRVSFERVSAAELWDAWDEMSEIPVGPSVGSVLFGFFVTLFFFVLLAALALGFFPARVSWLRKTIGDAPWRTLVQGVIGLSILLGAVPVTGLTIVGIPFLPFALLAIVVIWTLAYALGAYAVAMRLWVAFGNDPDPVIPLRLVVFAAAIIVVAMLNFIPFVGWVANYTLVLLGVGAMTHAALLAFVPDPDPALDVDMKPFDDPTSSN